MQFIIHAFRGQKVNGLGAKWLVSTLNVPSQNLLTRSHSFTRFWANAICRMTPIAQHRFISTFRTYLDAVVEQAEDRVAHHIRTIESYFQVRRETIGAKSSFALNEMYMNIPNHIMRHPVIEKLGQLSIDLIIIGNDLCSYNRE